MHQMHTQFEFPLNFTDVEQESTTYNRLYVVPSKITQNDSQIIQKLRDIDRDLFEDFTNIRDPQNFDFLYNLIKGFSDNIQFKQMKTLQRLIQSIHHMASSALKVVLLINEDQSIPEIRTSFKMIMFLVFFLVTTTALKKPKSQSNDVFEAMGKQKKKKGGKNQYIEVSKAIVETQKLLIGLMKEALDVNYVILWQRKQVQQEFFKKYTQTCVKILESTLGKDDEVGRNVFYIMDVIMRSQPALFQSVQISLINLVFENQIPDNLVNFFSRADGVQLQKLCSETIILIVIHLLQKSTVAAQSASVKNTKEFLSKLSQKVPKLFYNNLSVFIQLFESESYFLRNAISDIIMNILKFVVRGESEQLNKPRQKFVTTLLQRIYDKSSFCRSYVLGILSKLAVEKVVPRNFLILFLKAGVDRVKDSSVNTRKKAIQLINTLIDQLCGAKIKSTEQIETQLKMLSMDKDQLTKDQSKIKDLISHFASQKEQQQLISELKVAKKRLKMVEDKQNELTQERQISGLIGNVVTSVQVLLGSKTESDVIETIKLFIKLNKLHCQQARLALPHIRLLVFSRQKKIKDQVLSTFMYLHLSSPKSEEVAKELIRLFVGASDQDKSALEEILEIIIQESVSKGIVVIRPHVYAHLWNIFVKCEKENTKPQEKRVALTILRVAFSCDPNMLREEHLDSFLNMLKKYIDQSPDYHILDQISKILVLKNQQIISVAKNFLLAEIFILVNNQGTSDRSWYTATESILTAIFKLCQNPQKLTEVFLKKLHLNLQTKSNGDRSVAQFIFTLSHICLKILIHLDQIENKIKNRRNQQLANNSKENQQQELDQVLGGAEAELEKQIQSIQRLSEKILEDPFIKRWIQIIQKIINNIGKGDELQVISVLAYSKFMCISPSYCEKELPNLLKLLSKHKINPVIKNNIIIAIGDLLHRFPNIIEPHSRSLYRNLRDEDPGVRKTTLTVLTHLSLNDIIKVKSDMCEIALLFKDSDQEIESLVKQFFNQMNKKDPKILFNLIPESLNRFSNTDLGIPEDAFEVFFKNVLPMLQKDKYSQSLVAKLCERLSFSLNMLEIKNTSLCLSEMNLNEKCIRKILESFEGIRPKLQNQDVANNFKNLVTKLKKTMKTENKNLIDQLQDRVLHSNQEIYQGQNGRKRVDDKKKMSKKKKRHQRVNREQQQQGDEGFTQQKHASGRMEQQPNPSSQRRLREKKNNNRNWIQDDNQIQIIGQEDED